MKNCCVALIITLFVLNGSAVAQKKSIRTFRLGATVSFALSNIAANNVGIGGVAGAEQPVTDRFYVEAEMMYTYFTGDKAVYADAKNRAFAVPALAGIKYYPVSNIYGSLRTGAVYFLLNDMSSSQIKLAYGIAAGVNLPKKMNRLNIQLGYTGFRYQGVQRGYTTLAAAIIIN